jgi:hypothetical protein
MSNSSNTLVILMTMPRGKEISAKPETVVQHRNSPYMMRTGDATLPIPPKDVFADTHGNLPVKK